MIFDNISLVIIAKNEAEIISNLIFSVRDYFNQVIVVDTGSQDDTPIICTRLGVEVYFYKWNDNFSNPRNYGIDLARNEWILSLDADEYFEPQQIENIQNLLNDKSIGGINLVIKNSLDSSNVSILSEHRYTRLFRNLANIRYSGRIHEQIRQSILDQDLTIYESDLEILHYGYKESSISKLDRNKKLLLLELEEKPDDHWLKYHLAATEFANSNIINAKNVFNEIYLSNDLSTEQNEIVRIRLSQIALSENRFDEIYNYLDFKSINSNIEGFRKFILAATLASQQRFLEALELYRSSEVQSSNLIDQFKVKNFIESIEQINNQIK